MRDVTHVIYDSIVTPRVIHVEHLLRKTSSALLIAADAVKRGSRGQRQRAEVLIPPLRGCCCCRRGPPAHRENMSSRRLEHSASRRVCRDPSPAPTAATRTAASNNPPHRPRDYARRLHYLIGFFFARPRLSSFSLFFSGFLFFVSPSGVPCTIGRHTHTHRADAEKERTRMCSNPRLRRRIAPFLSSSVLRASCGVWRE